MISAHMLPQKCLIFRTVVDESESYVSTSEVLVGEHDCYISQNRAAVQEQGSPQHSVSVNLEALMNLPADIKSGDRLSCEGEDYTVGHVYKPANRHIQAGISQQEES